MNPFSTRYYLKQNKAKIFKIIFMISLISLVYVGGLYLTNISEEAVAIAKERKDFVEVRGTFDDLDGEQISELEQELMALDNVEAIATRFNYYSYKTMVGFSYGGPSYVFSIDDFKKFNDKTNIIPIDAEITENTILISDKQARYMNVKDGDLFWGNEDCIEIYHGDVPLNVVTFPSKAFAVYFITNDTDYIDSYLVTWKNGSSEIEFYQMIEELRNKYDKIRFETNEDILENLQKSFEINNVIYYSIIAILSIVFAITCNAVLIGIYDSRKSEFLLYKGIGIPKKSIYKKITFEILSMNGIGLIIGTGISILAVTLLNEFIYYKDGLSMWYYHPTALTAVIICDLAIIIPGIGLRIRNISREVENANFL